MLSSALRVASPHFVRGTRPTVSRLPPVFVHLPFAIMSASTSAPCGTGSGAGAGAGAGADHPRRVLIVGGVAGGASTAARLRRLDETAEIIMFEKGPYASFANCGLPYYVGDVIKDASKLVVADNALFHDRFRIQVRTNTEVTAIDTEHKMLKVRKADGSEVQEPYDACVIATGASPVKLPIPGIEGPGVFHLRTIPDSEAIRAWIKRHNATHVTVVGAGFTGMELVHSLRDRGMDVTLVERLPHVMAPMDNEFAAPIEAELKRHGVDVVCGDGVAEVLRPEAPEDPCRPMKVKLASGREITTSLVLSVAGARPTSQLAVAAGLEVTPRLRAVVVDSQMRTSAPDVWAVGDVVQSYRVLDHLGQVVPLAGLANRQGRVAAESIVGLDTHMREVQATAVCRAFGITISMTGWLDKALQHDAERWPKGSYHVIHTHPGNHASYYPGATPLHMKLAFSAKDGRVLGAQAVGWSHESVVRRIDVISMCIQMKGTVHDLAELEACYAPQYGSAKDPVNVAGMLAVNVLKGLAVLSDWDAVMAAANAVASGEAQADAEADSGLVVDVRLPEEFAAGSIPGAVNVPLETMRDASALDALPKGRPLHMLCRVGQRAYIAQRLLCQQGYDARLLSGGYQTYLALQPRGADGWKDIVEEYLRDLDK